jgi:hypothetical protein
MSPDLLSSAEPNRVGRGERVRRRGTGGVTVEAVNCRRARRPASRPER